MVMGYYDKDNKGDDKFEKSQKQKQQEEWEDGTIDYAGQLNGATTGGVNKESNRIIEAGVLMKRSVNQLQNHQPQS